jgi:hypothetical protein
MDNLWLDCHFEAPEDVTLNTQAQFKKFRVVFNKNGFLAWKKLMRRLSEPFSEINPTYNNIRVEWADRMAARSDGTNQGFFFNLDTWKGRVAEGKDFAKQPVFKPQNQPNLRAQFIDFWPAIWCEDRRSNGKVFGFGNELVG